MVQVNTVHLLNFVQLIVLRPALIYLLAIVRRVGRAVPDASRHRSRSVTAHRMCMSFLAGCTTTCHEGLSCTRLCSIQSKAADPFQLIYVQVVRVRQDVFRLCIVPCLRRRISTVVQKCVEMRNRPRPLL